MLATSVEGARPVLLHWLRRHGAFRGGGYRNVAIGRVAALPTFLDAVRDDLARAPGLAAALGRILPIERTLRLDPNDALASLEEAIVPLHPRLAGGSYFVRLERRGLRDALHSTDVERALGAALWRALEAAGHMPRVAFRDADAVIVIETLGDRAGIGIVDRKLRSAYPFVRIR